MDREAHIALTRAMFPNIKRGLIEQVSSVIDNPRMMGGNMFFMNYLMNNANPMVNDPMNLTRFGHRRYNHDVPTAALLGYMMGGEDGLNAAMAHLYEDYISNILHDTLGTDGRDMMSVLMRYHLNGPRNRRKERRMSF